MRKFAFIIALILAYFLGLHTRYEISQIPICKLVRVHDGDTIIVDIVNWPEVIGNNISVRINSIDCPEIHDKSEKVRDLACKAKRFTEEKTQAYFELKNLKRDKYFRLLADVETEEGNLADLLTKNGLAKYYDGGKKPDWSKR